MMIMKPNAGKCSYWSHWCCKNPRLACVTSTCASLLRIAHFLLSSLFYKEKKQQNSYKTLLLW